MSCIKVTIIAVLLASSLSAPAESRFSIGAQAGNASLDANFDGYRFDASETAFRVFGAWHFNDHLAIEAGYQTFGKFEQRFGPDLARIKADGFTFAARGSLPVSGRFFLQGRLGAFFWDGNASINDATRATPADSNVFIGLGAGWRFTPSLQLVGELTRFSLEPADLDTVSIGIEYRF